MPAVIGLFVGGESRRMGSPKALLSTASGETLLERARRISVLASLPIVLIGRRAETRSLGLPVLDDDPPGIGPLGGLAALLELAGNKRAIAWAVDMPFVTVDDLALLSNADGAAAAPCFEGRWEPLLASYDPAAVLPIVRRRIAAKEHSLQGLLDTLPTVVARIPKAHVRDWDRPEDVEADS